MKPAGIEDSQRFRPLDFEIASCRLEAEDVVIKLINRSPILVIDRMTMVFSPVPYPTCTAGVGQI